MGLLQHHLSNLCSRLGDLGLAELKRKDRWYSQYAKWSNENVNQSLAREVILLQSLWILQQYHAPTWILHCSLSQLPATTNHTKGGICSDEVSHKDSHWERKSSLVMTISLSEIKGRTSLVIDTNSSLLFFHTVVSSGLTAASNTMLLVEKDRCLRKERADKQTSVWWGLVEVLCKLLGTLRRALSKYFTDAAKWHLEIQ